MPGKRGQRGFGHVRRLPSKRWQASYIGPDLIRHHAPQTFDAKEDAEGWLAARRAEITGDDWKPIGRGAGRSLSASTLTAGSRTVR